MSAGGAIHRGPQDIPGIGRFAVAGDPQGAGFMLFQGTSSEAPPPTPAGSPGHVGWHELHAGDGQTAFAFYSGLFGWTKAEAMPMGDMGVYQIFAIDGTPAGGMMTKMPQSPAPFWLYYFNVEALDPAIERVKNGGGQIANGPMEVPGGSWIAQCFDPQGAMFAMVAPKR
jgi:predicted enzyme related to lactoylglutathione lyase